MSPTFIIFLLIPSTKNTNCFPVTMATPLYPPERRSRIKTLLDKLLGRNHKFFKVIRTRKLKSANVPHPEMMEDASHDAALPDPSFTTFASSSTNYTAPPNNQGCRSLLCFTNHPNSSNSTTSSTGARTSAFYTTGPSRSCAVLEGTLIPTAIQPQTFFLRGVPTPKNASSASFSRDDDDVNGLPDDRRTLPSQRRCQPGLGRTGNMRDMRQAYLDSGR